MTDRKKEMEETLLAKGREDKKPETPISVTSVTWGVFTVELKRLGVLAVPMVAVILSQYMLQVISIMMVGHLGELALSSTAIAFSLSGVTGFSLLVSLLSYIYDPLIFFLFFYNNTTISSRITNLSLSKLHQITVVI
jgi:MATE family multidrug resistance protein